jgi:hypothetical protein
LPVLPAKILASRLRLTERRIGLQEVSASQNLRFDMLTSPLFEIALVLVRLDHVARFIVNANHGIM